MLFLKLFGAESCRKATHGCVGISFLVIRENRCGAVEREEQRDIYSIPGRYSNTCAYRPRFLDIIHCIRMFSRSKLLLNMI
jgi:hypothetical protein